jgi:hypothetical protein
MLELINGSWNLLVLPETHLNGKSSLKERRGRGQSACHSCSRNARHQKTLVGHAQWETI